jgi:hypothetical protein
LGTAALFFAAGFFGEFAAFRAEFAVNSLRMGEDKGIRKPKQSITEPQKRIR